MPKMKTKKAAAKRMQLTATGRVKFKRTNKRHNLGSKNAARKLKLRSAGYLFPGDMRHVERCLPYGNSSGVTMPRAKRGFKRRRRHNKILDRAEGFAFGRKNKIRRASEAVDRANIYAFRDRRRKKREFRQLWIARLSAAAQDNMISYSRLVSALTKAQVALDRKVLSEIALYDPKGFTVIVEQVRSLAPAN